MAYAMTKQGSLDNCVTYEFICDAIEDMNAIEDRYRTIGTVAIVLSGASGLEVYIAGSDKQWNNLGAIGGSDSSAPSLAIHVCTSEEIDEGMPSIDTPDENTVYLVPSSEEEGNLYDEYIYVNEGWERFGAARIDLSGYVVKNNAVIENSISMGRVPNSVVGARSTALGSGVTASGSLSHAEGGGTTASGSQSHTEGGGTVASGESSHAEGSGTTASGNYSHAEGSGAKAIGVGAHAEGGGTASGDFSHAEGSGTRAIKNNTHAEGGGTTASGATSHAEGGGTTASGDSSHAEGGGTTASGNYSHAAGMGTTASGNYAHAEGGNTLASGEASHAEGGNTSAAYTRAHAEGCGNRTATKTINDVTFTGSGAHGINSHTEGYLTWAIGASGHAEGEYTVVIGDNAHAEGSSTTAAQAYAHAEGFGNVNSTKTIDNNTYTGTGAHGSSAHAEGYETWAIGQASHAEGDSTVASGGRSHTEGYNTLASAYTAHAEGYETTASNSYAHAEGYQTTAAGECSHIEGSGNKSSTITVNDITYTGTGAYAWASHVEGMNAWAIETASHAEGNSTLASGYAAHAEGDHTTASASYAHAEGYNTNASRSDAHAEGYQTTASGVNTHAEGYQTEASGYTSHAEGINAIASGNVAHAEGQLTIAAGSYSHVSGKYNTADSYDTWPEWTANTVYAVGDKVKITSETTVEGYICKIANNDNVFTKSHWADTWNQMNYVEIIGNGNAVDDRSNARALDWDGNEHLMGDIYVGCNADSTGGIKLPRIPEAPSTDGTYILQATVTNGTPTYSWTSLSSLSGVTF